MKNNSWVAKHREEFYPLALYFVIWKHIMKIIIKLFIWFVNHFFFAEFNYPQLLTNLLW